MPRIVVNRAVAGVPGDIAINVNERPAQFHMAAVGVPQGVIYRMAQRTFDLLLIAEAVFAADSLISRGGATRSELGAAWARDLRFVIPVSDSAFWIAEHETLVGVLGFLTGDRFAFQFVPRPLKQPVQPALDVWRRVEADEVVLLSGGLDSLVGTVDLLSSGDAKALLVTHLSSSKIMAIQRRLVADLQELFPGRTVWVPVRGTLRGVTARETTQRSRSFLFAALGFAAATLVGLPRLRFYENGVVSMNLPISRQVVGTMATRTTHPLFLRRLEDLLSRVADAPFRVENPYAGLTKTEVVGRLLNLGHGNLAGLTTSCSRVRFRRKDRPLCGCCSQCLDRRFAVLAAGLADHDPAERYEVEIFVGPRPNNQARTLAHDWTRHARCFDRMSIGDFTERFGAELSDVAAGCPERAPGSVISDAFQMHHRHGAAVRRVIENTIRDRATMISDNGVPSGSLLASLLLSGVESVAFAEEDLEADVPLPDALQPIFPLRLRFDPARGPCLTIVGLGEFKGAHLSLVGNLRPFLEADVLAGLPAGRHRWVVPRELGNKGVVRQHAKRCRDEFAERYEVVEGEQPGAHILVHSKARSGYRLDPDARFDDS